MTLIEKQLSETATIFIKENAMPTKTLLEKIIDRYNKCKKFGFPAFTVKDAPHRKGKISNPEVKAFLDEKNLTEKPYGEVYLND